MSYEKVKVGSEERERKQKEKIEKRKRLDAEIPLEEFLDPILDQDEEQICRWITYDKDINKVVDIYGGTIFHYVMRGSFGPKRRHIPREERIEIIKLLLKYKWLTTEDSVKSPTKEGELCCNKGFNLAYSDSFNRYTPAELACQQGEIEIFKLLIEAGGKCDSRKFREREFPGAGTPCHMNKYFQIIEEYDSKKLNLSERKRKLPFL